MGTIAIVAVGYNRPDSIEQLLNSLLRADYAEDQVDLVVSLDKGQRQQEIVAVALSGDMFKLTIDNFTYWRPMMEDHLYYIDLYEPILNQTMPEGKNQMEWEVLN